MNQSLGLPDLNMAMPLMASDHVLWIHHSPAGWTLTYLNTLWGASRCVVLDEYGYGTNRLTYPPSKYWNQAAITKRLTACNINQWFCLRKLSSSLALRLTSPRNSFYNYDGVVTVIIQFFSYFICVDHFGNNF